ncbi:hypothetical protein Drorol1_Dr00021268, partial [Drosera rotundifolia]
MCSTFFRWWLESLQVSFQQLNASYKASPLNAVGTAILTKLASESALSRHLSRFCSSANLFCSFDDAKQRNNVLEIGLGKLVKRPTSCHVNEKHEEDVDFSSYNGKQFGNYGLSGLGGVDTFKNYSNGINMPIDSFSRYSPASTGHSEKFKGYASNANIGSDTFTNYDQGATGGSGGFSSYQPNVNVPNVKFASYDSDGNSHELSFATYSDDTNSGTESFISYGKNGNGVPVEFSSYASTSNIVGSKFTGYSELGNGANDTFKGYSSNANNPNNNFKAYGIGGNSWAQTFLNYRDGANVGDDTFQIYGRNSNSAQVSFGNYGKSFNQGTDTFREYGKGETDRDIQFKGYGVNNTFKDYGDGKGIAFSRYTNQTSTTTPHGRSLNKFVEEGRFFRESMLKPGTVIKMPDIKDKMPRRSFLPRSISSKLPFSTSQLNQLKHLFHADDNSTLEHILQTTLSECERPPSQGETKKCIASIEDMIDFAVSTLGNNITVRTTENLNSSDQRVVIRSVNGINDGKVTRSVSCHQSLFPYMLYYCHSVPKVRVYEAEIMSLESNEKINLGVAICHLDTSSWSRGHGAFVALGFGPGLIEVCHWIFENDMVWFL